MFEVCADVKYEDVRDKALRYMSDYELECVAWTLFNAKAIDELSASEKKAQRKMGQSYYHKGEIP